MCLRFQKIINYNIERCNKRNNWFFRLNTIRTKKNRKYDWNMALCSQCTQNHLSDLKVSEQMNKIIVWSIDSKCKKRSTGDVKWRKSGQKLDKFFNIKIKFWFYLLFIRQLLLYFCCLNQISTIQILILSNGFFLSIK